MTADIIDNNIDVIRKDIISRGLTYEPLIDDITDHLCCMIEEKMEKGSSFEKAYMDALNSIGDNRLPEIQHQTLILLNKKHQKMKKLTYFLGLAAAILLLFGAVSKHMHWPGAGIELTSGLLIIILGFLPLYFIVTYREQTEKKNIIYPITGYVTIAVLLTGAVFKIQHWPAAGIVTNIGLAILIIGFVPLYTVNAFQKVKKKRISLAYIIMLLVGVAITILMFNVRITKDALEAYRDEAILNRTRIEETRERTSEITRTASDEENPYLETIIAINSSAHNLQTMIDEMLDELLISVNQENISLENLKKLDHEGAGRDIIVYSGWARDFITRARDYQAMLLEIIDDPVARNQVQDHLEFTGTVWYMEWGPRDVIYDPLIIIYYKHTDVSKGIALAEYVAADYLLNK